MTRAALLLEDWKDRLRSLRDPAFARLVSQAPSQAQTESPSYRRWVEMISAPPLERKTWEWAYVLEAFDQAGILQPGKRAIGFGVGAEPLPAVLASRGVAVVATDQPPTGEESVWRSTGQYAAGIEALKRPDICANSTLAERVTFRHVDMRGPLDTLGSFDAVWSSCCFEHLGSLETGLDFAIRSCALLRPGGTGVHTTEYNVSSDEDTLEAHNLVLYRRQELRSLARRLRELGYRIALNWKVPMVRPADRFVDQPPYSMNPHLRLRIDRYVVTSFGFIIERPA